MLANTIALCILLVSIIRVNRMIKRDYPKLKLRQVSSLVHVTVGMLGVLAYVLILTITINLEQGNFAIVIFFTQ